MTKNADIHFTFLNIDYQFVYSISLKDSQYIDFT